MWTTLQVVYAHVPHLQLYLLWYSETGPPDSQILKDGQDGHTVHFELKHLMNKSHPAWHCKNFFLKVHSVKNLDVAYNLLSRRTLWSGTDWKTQSTNCKSQKCIQLHCHKFVQYNTYILKSTKHKSHNCVSLDDTFWKTQFSNHNINFHWGWDTYVQLKQPEKTISTIGMNDLTFDAILLTIAIQCDEEEKMLHSFML